MKLLKTGITGLDELLRGGLPPKVLLLSGEPGSATEVFAQQVAYNLARQTHISYLTLNKTVEQVRLDMLSFGWDLKKLESSNNWRFISVPADQLRDVIEGEMRESRSIVVDSLSDAFYGGEALDVLDVLRFMSRQNTRFQGLHLALITKGMHDHEVEVAAQHISEGVVDFTVNQGPEYVTRRMCIKKLAGAILPVRNITYVVGEKGVTIDTALRIT